MSAPESVLFFKTGVGKYDPWAAFSSPGNIIQPTGASQLTILRPDYVPRSHPRAQEGPGLAKIHNF